MRHPRIFGTGEMADLVRQKDWASTPLGALETWPEDLRVSVNTVLAVPTPMQVFWGPEMILIYNDALRPFLAGKHPNALGQPARQVWSEAWDAIGAQMQAVFSEGRSFAYEDLPLTLLQDGQPRNMFWTFTYSPIFDAEGKVVGLLNAAQDTTDAVHAQSALQASEARFRKLIDHASVGIVIGNMRGELTYVNPTLLRTLGYTVDDVKTGKLRWDRLTPPEYAHLDAVAVEQLVTSGIAEPYEKAYFTKQGQPIPLLIGASVLPSETTGDVDVAVFATDLRRQKRAEAALLQSEKLAAVGKLASSISHEINNPLEAVTNLLYIVRGDPNLSQSSRDHLETADRELARVSQVTSHTLRFHRQSTNPRTVTPDSLVDEVLRLYSGRMSNSGIRIRREYRPNVLVTCYEGDIRQILSNLVGNALDAMRTGGRLVLRTRNAAHPATGEPGVLVTIADTGSGMSPEDRAHVFNAFYTTKGINGTGLGLWISTRIVGKHRGYLRFHTSVHPTHHGTVFHLWLPLQLASTARDSWHEEQALPA